MKILDHTPYAYEGSQCDISPAELYNKFDIKTIYLAYHDADLIAIGQIGSPGNMGMSGYVLDSISFYYFILKQNDESELKLAFNLSSGSWNLNDSSHDLDSSEKIRKLDRQNAINLIGFIDLFGM